MLAEIKAVFSIIEEFCMENYIIILICTNALALLLAIISLVVASRKKKKPAKSALQDDMLLNLNIERAEVNIARLRQGFGEKLESESTEDTENIEDATDANILEKPEGSEDKEVGSKEAGSEEIGVSDLREESAEQAKARCGIAQPVVIEKLIPVEPKRPLAERSFTSKSGIVYSEEEILAKIKD